MVGLVRKFLYRREHLNLLIKVFFLLKKCRSSKKSVVHRKLIVICVWSHYDRETRSSAMKYIDIQSTFQYCMIKEI
jgi:hypothetical protein